MSINDPLFGILVYVCALVINRILGEKALKRLTPEQKVKLLDSFAGHRIYSTVAIFVLILVFFIVGKTSPDSYLTLTWVFAGLLIVMSIGSTLFTYTKLKSSSAPQHFITNFFVRCVVYYTGLVILLVTMARYFPR